jgi:hypothetical protein
VLRSVLRLFGLGDHEFEDQLRTIAQRREKLSELTDDQLKSAARIVRCEADVVKMFALAAAIAERVLGLRIFEVQILGALALQRGYIAEMKTGEGKTLAAVPAVIWDATPGPRRTRANGQRLSCSPRRHLDARNLCVVRPFRRSHLPDHAPRATACRLPM